MRNSSVKKKIYINIIKLVKNHCVTKNRKSYTPWGSSTANHQNTKFEKVF